MVLGGVLVGTFIAIAGVALAGEQDRPTPKLSRPPTQEERSVPGGERAETREFLDNARRLYDRAYRLRESAEALRDGNRYEEAESFEERALDLEDQARQYERRAEESRMPATSRRPAPIEE